MYLKHACLFIAFPILVVIVVFYNLVLIDIHFFGSMIYNFGNCANVNSRLRITWKDEIKREVPFVKERTQGKKNCD